VIVLKTQSPAYWQKEFVVDDHDLELLHRTILDAGAPMSMQALTLAVIKERCKRELDARRSEIDRGPMYQPKDSYIVGQTIVFPAFGFSAAKIVDTRPGYDPARGEFEVIKVQFEGTAEQREFASRLQSPHPLNREAGDDGLGFLRNVTSPDELLKSYGAEISAKLLQRMTSPTQSDFVQYQGNWLVREMMAEINIGHLNIAEAAIDVAGVPLTTEQILRNLDLPAEIGAEIQRFSLNAALSADERFSDVGWDGQVMWFLRRMEPVDAIMIPGRLQWIVEPYDPRQIIPDLAAIEKEIDDEMGSAAAGAAAEATYSARITLTYPHLRSGTLPLSTRVRALFPKGSFQRTRVELIDGQRGETMIGWVNHEGGYVVGLADWYHRYQIPAGAYIRLERTKRPTVVIVNFEPRRLRREWVRVAGVSHDTITFSLQKRPISCEYDEMMAVDHADARQMTELDALAEKIREERRPLGVILSEVVPELVKLSPAGTVHAKTVYSAVNVVRRCPPGAVFAILSSDPRYVNVGNGLWAYDEPREGKR